MKLAKLQLENFRNYSQYLYDFDLNQSSTILVGPNGLGKTNFLEAIYILSLGRSFRTSNQSNLINWKKDYFRCKCELIVDQEKEILEVFYSQRPKKQKNFKKNSVNLKNSQYIGSLLTVLFHPEDLNLLYLRPGLRRKYLNVLLSQTNKSYLFALTNYNKILKQRNSLLSIIREKKFKRGKIEGELINLEIWDDQLIEHGSIVIIERKKLLDYLNDHLQSLYRNISGQSETLQLSYKSTVDTLNIKQSFKEKLLDQRNSNILRARTSIGPHRDDISFYLDGKLILESASRGEFRTILLAMKLVEIDYIKQQTGYQPILLLDDVFSELDPNRQNHLLEAINSCQTIITTTDLANIKNLQKSSSIINL